MEIVNPWGLLIAAGGLFGVAGALFNWDWFIESEKAELLLQLLGRTGTRIFYFILGAGITVLGVLLTIGVLKDAAQ